MDKSNKRSQYIVDMGFQLRYMTAMLLSLLFVSVIVGWTIYYSIWDPITSTEISSSEELGPIFASVNQALAIRLPFLVIIAGVISIFLSHRIAGPVYKIKQSAKIFAQGDLSTRIKLRKGDELQCLANIFNRMAENLEKDVITSQRILNRFNSVLNKMPKNPDMMDAMTPNSKQQLIDDFFNAVAELKQVTGQNNGNKIE